MNLQYRGISYSTRQSTVETTAEVIGLYRGAVMSRRCATHANKPVQGLKYRGAAVR